MVNTVKSKLSIGGVHNYLKNCEIFFVIRLIDRDAPNLPKNK